MLSQVKLRFYIKEEQILPPPFFLGRFSGIIQKKREANLASLKTLV